MRAAGGVCVRLPDFSLSRFGAVNIVDRKRIQPEEIISAYERADKKKEIQKPANQFQGRYQRKK